jgi:hypothetical protein
MVTDEAVAPTCTETGLTEGSHCSRCDYVVAQEVVPALGHDFGEWVVTTEPTREAAGEETRTCSRCGATETRPVAALEGYLIKTDIKEAGLGTATISGKSLSDYDGGKLFAEGVKYTVTATPNDNAQFIGWAIGSRIVSEEVTYSNYAYTDLTLTAVFVEKPEEEQQTIVFVNKFGDILSTQTVGSVAVPNEADPSANNLPGYNFVGWTKDGEDISADEIKALTESAKIVGKYEKNTDATGYTVTAEGAKIYVDGVEYDNVAEGIAYDKKVKVVFEGATAIKCGEEFVSYSDTFEFYIAGDTELTPYDGDIDSKPAATVKVIGANRVDGTATKFNIYATRTVDEENGWKAIDRGFIYGVDSNFPAGYEASVDNIPANCRVCHGEPTASQQFTLKVGVGAGKTARFYAFVTVKNAAGDVETVYSDAYYVNG